MMKNGTPDETPVITNEEIVNKIITGFALIKIVDDQEGRPLDYKFIDLNPAYASLFRKPKESVIGKTYRELVPNHSEESTDWVGLFADVADGGESVVKEAYFGAADRWISFQAYSPEKGYVLILGRDITKRKRAELDLKQINNHLEELIQQRTMELEGKNRILEEMNRQLESTLSTLKKTQKQLIESEKMAGMGNLVAGIAHEINTPLGVCLTAASIIEEKTAEPPNEATVDNDKIISDVHRSACLIQKNLGKAADLINNFKQVAVDQSATRTRSLDGFKTLDAIVKTLSSPLSRENVEIETRVPASWTLNADPGALAQIIRNLVFNAQTHGTTPPSPLKILIEFRRIDQNQVLLAVTDNGRGISEEIQPKIFEPFFTTSRNRGHSGLGLHIVYNLVSQSLKGTIEYKQAEPKGSRFEIHFPS